MSRRPPTILTVMNDPRTFGPFFTGDTWDAWRAYLAAKHALPMTPRMHELFVQCTGRTRPPARRVKRCVTIVGRRGGKDEIESFETAYDAAFTDFRPYLAPGEVSTLVLLAADRRQSGVLFSRIEAYFDNIPLLKRLVTNRTKDSLELGDRRVEISVMTASHRTVRGITAGRVSGNETAFWRTEESATPDVEIIRGVEPAMATIPSAMLTLMSTPYSRSGLLFRWCDQFWAQDRDDILVWRAPTWVMNPTIDRAVIDAAYEDDPAAAAAEYGAEFRTDLAAFVAPEVVDGCISRGVFERAPLPDIRYTAFVDPSGGSSDSMTLAIAHHEPEDSMLVLDCIREVVPPFSPAAVCRSFAEVLKSYGLRRCEGDKYAGVWPREQFAEHGIEYVPTARPKSEIYIAMLSLLNSGRVDLLDSRKLRGQLLALERRTSRGGRDVVAEPPRAHDDVANACMGALLAAQAEPAVTFAPVGMTRISPWRMWD